MKMPEWQLIILHGYAQQYQGSNMGANGMVSSSVLISVVAGIAMCVSPNLLLAQEKVELPPNPDQRFQFERQAKGYLRLDKKTGETSFCRQVINELICELAIEERNILHEEIADLQNQLVALQEKLDAIGMDNPPTERPKIEIPNPETKEGMGSERDNIEREVDRAIEVTKHTMRKLFEAVKELQKEFENESLN
jgi:hypothetical protein